MGPAKQTDCSASVPSESRSAEFSEPGEGAETAVSGPTVRCRSGANPKLLLALVSCQRMLSASSAGSWLASADPSVAFPHVPQRLRETSPGSVPKTVPKLQALGGAE